MAQKLPYQLLKPLLSDPNWELMMDYLKGERDLLVTKLCKCRIEELPKLQGQVEFLDKLFNLKQQLKTEEGRKF